MTFTLDDENHITAHRTFKKARETGWDVFSSEKQFASIVGLGNRRLLEIWNNLAGVKPVTRFTSRSTAIRRIWKVIEDLEPSSHSADGKGTQAQINRQRPAAFGADASEQEPPRSAPDPDLAAAHVASIEKAPLGTKAACAPNNTKSVGAASKIGIVLTLLKREGGATSKELIAATGWQPHTIRGFISGTLRKKMGLAVGSGRTGSGERAYSIRDCGAAASRARGAVRA